MAATNDPTLLEGEAPPASALSRQGPPPATPSVPEAAVPGTATQPLPASALRPAPAVSRGDVIAGPGSIIAGHDEEETLREQETLPEQAPLPAQVPAGAEASGKPAADDGGSARPTMRGVAVARSVSPAGSGAHPPGPAGVPVGPMGAVTTAPLASSTAPGEFVASAGPQDPTQLELASRSHDTMRMVAGPGNAGRDYSPGAYGAVAVAPGAGPRPSAPPGRARATPRWTQVVVGVAMIVIGGSLLAGYLPRVAPVSRAEAARLAAAAHDTVAHVEAARLSREAHLAVTVGAVGLLVFGLLAVALGARYRSQVEVVCRACRRRVFAARATFGLDCPACGRYARLNWPLVVGTTVFWVGVIAMGIALAVVMSA